MTDEQRDEECPEGRTDYEACFAPFRFCPVKGCGRVAVESREVRWNRIAATVMSAKEQFDALPMEERAALREHLRRADEAAADLIADWWEDRTP